MHTTLLSKVIDGRTGKIVVDKTIDLGRGQEGLRIPNRPDDLPPNVP